MSNPIEEFLDWARIHLGDRRLVRMIETSFKRKAAPLALDDFLDLKQIRARYRRAVKVDEGEIVNQRLLAEVLRLSGVTLSLDLGCPPWDNWIPGSTVYIVAGVRKVLIPDVSEQMTQRAVGGRDAESMMMLATLFQSRLQIDAEVRPVFVPSDLSLDEANKRLDQLKTKPGVGAVVVLGSSLVNPLAESVARQVLADAPAKVQFHWRCESPMSSVLNDPYPCADGEEGISLNGRLYRRVRDDVIATKLAKPARKQAGTFPDAGLLLFDARTRPFIIGCLGHGGCGTLSCCEALEGQEEIANRLLVGKNRLIEVLEVKRRKQNSESPDVDDLVVDSWSYATEV